MVVVVVVVVVVVANFQDKNLTSTNRGRTFGGITCLGGRSCVVTLSVGKQNTKSPS